MKVLTLHQPWATLIALGVKTIETRGQAFRSLVGQRIAIHAAATMGALNYLCWQEDHDGETPDVLLPVRHLLTVDQRDNGIVRAVHGLPLGAIVATALVTESLQVRNVHAGATDNFLWHSGADLHIERGGRVSNSKMVTDQLPYGDFRPGRFGLLLADVRSLAEPIPFKGGQGLSRSIDPALLGTGSV